MRRLVLAAAVAALALVTAAPALAGGGGHGSDRCAGFAKGDEVVMLDSCFAGTAHFAGESVTVVNDGQFPHTYTAVDRSFDTGILNPGESAQLAFKGPGTFEVFCTLHGTAEGFGMAGVLVVGGGAAAAAVPAAIAPEPAPPPAGNADLVAALDRQSEAIAELTAQEAALLGRMATVDTEPAGWPPQLTVILLVAALAVVGVVIVTWAPGRTGAEQRIGQPNEA